VSLQEYNTVLVKMENAKPGQAVELHGLQGAAHLNGTRGHLVRFLREEQRWVVSCEGNDYKVVNVKPANLKRAEPEKECTLSLGRLWCLGQRQLR